MSDELKKKIKNLAGSEGFWRSSTFDILESSARTMLAKGFTEDEAFILIEGMWDAVSSEYGN